MAAAMARAAITVAMKNKRAAMLEAIKQQQQRNYFNAEQRQQLLMSLSEDSQTRFLANLVEGEAADNGDVEHVAEIQEVVTAGHGMVDWDDYEGSCPTSRPHFLSKRHWRRMKKHFKGRPPYDPTWMQTYVRTSPEDKNLRQVPSIMHTAQQDQEDRVSKKLKIPALPALYLYCNEFILANQLLCASNSFNSLVLGCIIIAGILVGAQSYPSMDSDATLNIIDLAVQIVFTCECAFKICAQGRYPLEYWTGIDRYWNNFDFWLVFVVWLPFEGGNVAILRLFRLMRLLKLVGKVKQLQVIVMGLAKGLSSVSYIMILMFLIFYLFAVMGVGQFRENDPFHFGSLGVAMLTLFRCATLEDWSDVMYINYYGCDSQYNGVNGGYYGLDGGAPWAVAGTGERGASNLGEPNEKLSTAFGDFPVAECWSPVAQPVLSTVYFVFFILIAAFVIMSLFVGAVCGGMYEAMDQFKAQEAAEKSLLEKRISEEENQDEEKKVEKYDIPTLQDAFEAFDEDQSGEIDAEELCSILTSLGEQNMTTKTAQKMIDRVDMDGDSTLNMGEFILMMTMGDLEGDGAGGDKTKVDGVTGNVADASLKAASDIIKYQDLETARCIELVGKIRMAWETEEHQKYDFDAIESEYKRAYLKLSLKAEALANHPAFASFIMATIIMAGVVVGVQTEIANPASDNSKHEADDLLNALDSIILFIFTIEVVVKMVAEGHRPLHFFADPWNFFDFVIVAACFVFMLPFMPDAGGLVAMLRLLRLLRVLKLVKALPQLRVIIEALISGFGSISFVTIILFMFFYLFSIMGMLLFRENDPMHFGNLHIALVSLFRGATLDDWSDIMYVNMFGCDVWGYEFGRAFDQKGYRKQDHVNCNHPHASGWLAGAYMVVFTVLGALVLLTLFIGVVVTAMEEAKEEQQKELKAEHHLMARIDSLGILPGTPLQLYRNVFEYLVLGTGGNMDGALHNSIGGNNKKKTGKLDRNSLKPLMRALPHVFDSSDASEAQRQCIMTKEDLEKLIQIVDEEYSGLVGFSEFLVLLDFMRRVDKDPEVLLKFKGACHRATTNHMEERTPKNTWVTEPVDEDGDNIPLFESPSPSSVARSKETGLERKVREQEEELKALRSELAHQVQMVADREAAIQKLSSSSKVQTPMLVLDDESPTTSLSLDPSRASPPVRSSSLSLPSSPKSPKVFFGLFRSSSQASMVAPSSD